MNATTPPAPLGSGASAAALDRVRAIARDLHGTDAERVLELPPHATLRAFRCDDVVIKLDDDAAGVGLDVEARVLDVLLTATDRAIAPPLLASGRLEDDGGRRWIAYPWTEGKILDAASARARAPELGRLFATLHGARVMDLGDRLPQPRPLTLLESFRKLVDEVRAWMIVREADGLAQDRLTLALSDLQRSLRGYVIALDHHFLMARRRVLCHGRSEPAFVVARAERAPLVSPLVLVGFDAACLGDAAEDLATFAIAAELDEDAEDALLDAYLTESEQLSRLDRRFVSRYFARRALALLSRPVQRLALIEKIRRGKGAVLGDPVAALEEHVQRGYVEVAHAINGLQELAGRSRPVRVQDVIAMGRLVAYEEMILAGTAFRIAITGQPYSGKTEVGALLARRLRHSYISTGALGRALALVEQTGRERENAEVESARGLVKALFDAGFTMTSSHDAPYYRVELAGADVTAVLGDTAQLQVRGAQLLDDDAVRAAVRDALAARTGAGLVVEGAYAATLLSGAAWHFHLTGDPGVRRARLMSHRPDVESEQDAEKLLRRLDEGQKSDGVDPTVIDVGSRPAAAAALEVLWHLLPAARRPGAVAAGSA